MLNLLLALGITALLVLATGSDPAVALTALATGSLGSLDAVGYTLYYATNMAFTGLAVAVAFQGGCSTSARRARPRWRGSARCWRR